MTQTPGAGAGQPDPDQTPDQTHTTTGCAGGGGGGGGDGLDAQGRGGAGLSREHPLVVEAIALLRTLWTRPGQAEELLALPTATPERLVWLAQRARAGRRCDDPAGWSIAALRRGYNIVEGDLTARQRLAILEAREASATQGEPPDREGESGGPAAPAMSPALRAMYADALHRTRDAERIRLLRRTIAGEDWAGLPPEDLVRVDAEAYVAECQGAHR